MRYLNFRKIDVGERVKDLWLGNKYITIKFTQEFLSQGYPSIRKIMEQELDNAYATLKEAFFEGEESE